MVSITSVISFAIVLLAASSYSAPIDTQPDSSKLYVKNPKVKPVVNQSSSISELPDRKYRSSEEADSDEITTQDVARRSDETEEKYGEELTTESFTHSPRVFEDKDINIYEATTDAFTRSPRVYEGKDSYEMTTDAFTRPSRVYEGKDSYEMTTDAFTRSPRVYEDKDSYEMTTDAPSRSRRGYEGKDNYEMTTDAFTRSPRVDEGKDSYEMTTDAFTRSPRVYEGKDNYEMTTDAFTRSPRVYEGKDNYEMTTDAFTRSPRVYEGKDSYEMTTDVFTQSPRSFNEYSYPSSTEENQKRAFVDLASSLLESSSEFNRRAIRPLVSQEEMESSSFPYDHKKPVDVEASPSVQSFGKSTGLLQDETNDRSNEEYNKYPKPVKTVSVIPGKVRETKIYAKSPVKSSAAIEPAEQDQLSQVQHQSNFEKTKPDN